MRRKLTFFSSERIIHNKSSCEGEKHEMWKNKSLLFADCGETQWVMCRIDWQSGWERKFVVSFRQNFIAEKKKREKYIFVSVSLFWKNEGSKRFEGKIGPLIQSQRGTWHGSLEATFRCSTRQDFKAQFNHAVIYLHQLSLLAQRLNIIFRKDLKNKMHILVEKQAKVLLKHLNATYILELKLGYFIDYSGCCFPCS